MGKKRQKELSQGEKKRGGTTFLADLRTLRYHFHLRGEGGDDKEG